MINNRVNYKFSHAFSSLGDGATLIIEFFQWPIRRFLLRVP